MRNITLCLLLIVVWSCKKDDTGPDKDKGHTKSYSAEVATGWYTLITDISRNTPFPPPPSIRLFAYSGLTLYESVLPGMPSYRSAFTLFTNNTIAYTGKSADGYWPAAANAALARILSKMLSDYPNPKLAANLNAVQQLETYFNNQFAQAAPADRLQSSIDFGRLAADSVYNWSKKDGTFNPDGSMASCAPYVPLGTPGKWQPTPPGFFPAAGACQGSLRTFIPGIVTSTLPPPPTPYSVVPLSEYYDMMDDIRSLRSSPDPIMVKNGEAWRDLVGTNYNTPAHMMRLTVNILNAQKTSLEDAAVLFAREGIAIFDAVAAVFYAKFYYAVERPITYIRNVLGQTTWDAQFPTVQHPAYPSTGTCAAAAAASILENYFGSNFRFVDSTQENLYGSWPHSTFNHLVNDVVSSRVYTGQNFRLAAAAGVDQGRKVSEKILSLPFKKN